jgi:putative acyl-CoA dehydrogenase
MSPWPPSSARRLEPTHEVTNQAPPLEGYNVFERDTVLVEALRREGGGWAAQRARDAGAFWGGDPQEWGRLANENPPKLRTHDRFGNRIDEVEFHPAWHELLRLGISQGLHASPWRDPRPGAHVARAAKFILLSQVEAGVGCPISMTYSVIPAIRKQPELATEWEPRFLSLSYDGERLVPAPDKLGALCGMAMTEKQGGSDVRANTTVARPLNGGGPGTEYEITGHKWFCSAPMCDAFLVLAQADGGLSCFLLPRFTPDGERNRFHIQRLKDKLGNRSNASSEVEFRGAWARLAGEEGRGVPTIIDMVNHTRLDCVIGASAGFRWGTAMAIHHASHRSAFGKPLVEQPLMRNVLADLAVESEAATISALWLARAFDETHAGDERAVDCGGWRRPCSSTGPASARRSTRSRRWSAWAATATSRSPGCPGSTGRARWPRSGRDRATSSVWTCCGRWQEPRLGRDLLRRDRRGARANPHLDTAAAELREELSDLEAIEARARRVVEWMALVLQGSLLARFGDPAVVDAFSASRLGGDAGRAFGTLPAGVDFGRIIERHAPSV